MRVKGEAYSRRLESYSDDTLYMISQLMAYKDLWRKMNEITTTTESEKEVQKKLKPLMEELNRRENETEIHYQMDSAEGRTVRVSSKDLKRWMEGQSAIEKGQAPHLSEESRAKFSDTIKMNDDTE